MRRKRVLGGGLILLIVAILFSSCQPQPEPQVVEVTRVVTETVVETVEVEGETVEVTRVVEETVIETVTVEVEVAEEEAADDLRETFEEAQQIEPGGNPPLSTGSEGDAIPLPTPNSGPKVEVTRSNAQLILDEALPGEARTEINLDSAVPPPLSAGIVNDNENWANYLAYLEAYTADDVIEVGVSDRTIFQVVNELGEPASEARIVLETEDGFLTELRVHSDGRAFFYPDLYSAGINNYTATITHNDNLQTISILAANNQETWLISMPAPASANNPIQLDILFLMDITGSMTDELDQLQGNIQTISLQINALPVQPDVRFGLVAYQDEADALEILPFTGHIEQFATALSRIEAKGGGDYPEDLHRGLETAVLNLNWRLGQTVSLIFLVADAPPRFTAGEYDYIQGVRDANTRGIKIFSLAGSGLDKQGEYIFRQMAQMSDGRFIFLLSEQAGISDQASDASDVTFAVANYSVAALDELIVRLVEEELKNLNP
ncbi:MAG: VWA domain-containing protein [Chloroflexi bacterium]|nr:VWA domain-containing protein [Chloroflexota bacterium]